MRRFQFEISKFFFEFLKETNSTQRPTYSVQQATKLCRNSISEEEDIWSICWGYLCENNPATYNRFEIDSKARWMGWILNGYCSLVDKPSMLMTRFAFLEGKQWYEQKYVSNRHSSMNTLMKQNSFTHFWWEKLFFWFRK